MSDLLRRKTGDVLLPVREERRRPLLVRNVLCTELQLCKSFTRVALVPSISPDVLVGRALPLGAAEDSVAHGKSTSTASSLLCRAVELTASLAQDVVLPTRWCTSGSVPDLPVTTARAVVWPRGESLRLSAAVQRELHAVRDDDGNHITFACGVVPTAARSEPLFGCEWPDFLRAELASAASPAAVFSTSGHSRWCEVVFEVLPLRRLPTSEPNFPCDFLLEAGVGHVLPRRLAVADGTVRVDMGSLAQTVHVAFWESDVVTQAMALFGGSSTEAGATAGAKQLAQQIDPAAVRDEHQRVPSTLTTMDCPVCPRPAAPDLTVPVAKCNSLPSTQAVVTVALHGLGAAAPAARGSWALSLFGDRSVLPWRWHSYGSSVVIEAPTAWALGQAADRVLESLVFTATQGLVAARALSDVRRHVDSFLRACTSTVGLSHPRATAARLEHSLVKLLTMLSSSRPTGAQLVDHAATLENDICSYVLLDQPDSAMAGPIESRRPGQQNSRKLPGGFAPRNSRTLGRGTHPHVEPPMNSLRALSSGGATLGGALGELNAAKSPMHDVPLAFSSPRTRCAAPLHRLARNDVAFSEADSSTGIRASRSGSGDPAAPPSATPSGSGRGSSSAGFASEGGAAAALAGTLCRKPQPPRILRNPQQLHVVRSQRDMAAQLLGRSTVILLPPPAQPLSLVCLLAETYLRTSGFDHRCLWLSSASTASLANAFEFHQKALPEHHLVLLDAEPRGSSRAAAAAAQFVFASVSAARMMLMDRCLFSFVVFDCGASAFQAKELSDVVALQPLLRLMPSTTVLLVEDAVSSLGVAVRDVDHVCAMASMAQCGVTSALVRHSADNDVRGIVRASANEYVEPSAPVRSTLRLLDDAAGPLIRPLWHRRHPILCAAGSRARAGSLLLPPAPDTAPTLRDLVADNLSGAVIEMQNGFVAAEGPMQTTLIGRGSLSDLKVLTTLHVLRCARDHALLHGVDTCIAFLNEAQGHYEDQVQNLRPWCQRIEEEMWDAGAGQPSVAAALQQIIAVESGGSVLIVASQDLATISSALPNVRRLNSVGLTEPASPRVSSSESSAAAEVLVADHDDLAAVSDSLYSRLALVLLVSTSLPVALTQFLSAGVVRCRFIRMSEAAAAATQEENRVAAKFDAAVRRCQRAADPNGDVRVGLMSLSALHENPAPSVIRLPSRFCENRTPSQLSAVLASQLPPPPSTGLVVSLEVGPAFLVSFSAAVTRVTSAIVSSSLLCSRVSLTVNFPAGADMTMLARPGGLSRPGPRRGPGSGSGGSSSSGHSRHADTLFGRGRGRGRGARSNALKGHGGTSRGGSCAPMRPNLAAAPPKRRYSVAGTSQQDCRQTRLHVVRRA